jgi:hypothetical protein
MRRVQATAGFDIMPSVMGHFETNGRITTAFAACEDAGSGQDLRAMTNGGNRLVGVCEMTHDLKDSRVESEVLRSATTRKDQRIETCGVDGVEVGVQPESVPRLLTIGLMSLEIMDGRGHEIPLFLVGASGMAAVPDHEEELVRDHYFIVLDKVTDQKKDTFGSQSNLQRKMQVDASNRNLFRCPLGSDRSVEERQ